MRDDSTVSQANQKERWAISPLTLNGMGGGGWLDNGTVPGPVAHSTWYIKDPQSLIITTNDQLTC